MMKKYFLPFILYAPLMFFGGKNIVAQDSLTFKPVVIEAELGATGDNYVVLNDGDITYATATKDYSGQAYPEGAASVITFQIAFPDSGNYHLYARLRVGANGYNDDSFFAGKGFGDKNLTSNTDWVMVNGLGGAGFSSVTDVVKDKGAVGSEVWKWVNISQNFFSGGASDSSFYVSADSLTRVFQIGSREDGLDFDKFAFGRSDLYFTVNMLNKGLSGSETEPVPDSSKFYKGPPLAEGSPKFLGNVKGYNDNNFANLWNQITPGNEGKWASIAGSSSDTTKWDWSGLDNLYNYAKANNLLFKEHTLIWGSQQPSWINSLSEDQQLMYIESWIRQVGKRYPDAHFVDVVNEPLNNHNPPDGVNDRANYKEALGGNGTTGWDWVIKSFELARKYLPNAKLLLNDYGIINDNNSTTTYLKIVNLLKERGLIDGIGVQGHRFELENASVNTLKYNIDRLGATGLPVYMTEVDLGNLGDTGTPNDDQQLQLYQKIFPVLWENQYVHGVTLWGYVENQMWQPTCYLALADGTWRPALKWLAQYIKDTPVEIYQPVSAPVFGTASLVCSYPNPFSTSANFQFAVEKTTNVSLKIYDIQGSEVATLVNRKLDAGDYQFSWNAENSNGAKLPAGTYFYRFVTDNNSTTQKILRVN